MPTDGPREGLTNRPTNSETIGLVDGHKDRQFESLFVRRVWDGQETVLSSIVKVFPDIQKPNLFRKQTDRWINGETDRHSDSRQTQ